MTLSTTHDQGHNPLPPHLSESIKFPPCPSTLYNSRLRKMSKCVLASTSHPANVTLDCSLRINIIKNIQEEPPATCVNAQWCTQYCILYAHMLIGVNECVTATQSECCRLRIDIINNIRGRAGAQSTFLNVQWCSYDCTNTHSFSWMCDFNFCMFIGCRLCIDVINSIEEGYNQLLKMALTSPYSGIVSIRHNVPRYWFCTVQYFTALPLFKYEDCRNDAATCAFHVAPSQHWAFPNARMGTLGQCTITHRSGRKWKWWVQRNRHTQHTDEKQECGASRTITHLLLCCPAYHWEPSVRKVLNTVATE